MSEPMTEQQSSHIQTIRSALISAQEWAASFELGGGLDRKAADLVYEETCTALTVIDRHFPQRGPHRRDVPPLSEFRVEAVRDAIEKVMSLTLSPRGGATVLASVLVEAMEVELVEERQRFLCLNCGWPGYPASEPLKPGAAFVARLEQDDAERGA